MISTKLMMFFRTKTLDLITMRFHTSNTLTRMLIIPLKDSIESTECKMRTNENFSINSIQKEKKLHMKYSESQEPLASNKLMRLIENLHSNIILKTIMIVPKLERDLTKLIKPTIILETIPEDTTMIQCHSDKLLLSELTISLKTFGEIDGINYSKLTIFLGQF